VEKNLSEGKRVQSAHILQRIYSPSWVLLDCLIKTLQRKTQWEKLSEGKKVQSTYILQNVYSPSWVHRSSIVNEKILKSIHASIMNNLLECRSWLSCHLIVSAWHQYYRSSRAYVYKRILGKMCLFHELRHLCSLDKSSCNSSVVTSEQYFVSDRLYIMRLYFQITMDLNL
jgi:hypothetical protein